MDCIMPDAGCPAPAITWPAPRGAHTHAASQRSHSSAQPRPGCGTHPSACLVATASSLICLLVAARSASTSLSLKPRKERAGPCDRATLSMLPLLTREKVIPEMSAEVGWGRGALGMLSASHTWCQEPLATMGASVAEAVARRRQR